MKSVAVLIPCYNEEKTIAEVIKAFKKNLPFADIYVYDNGSTDKTAEVAQVAGAIVREERRRGKGCVVRRMFSDIEADVFVVVDGDLTYNAADAPKMIDTLIKQNLDMVVATRREKNDRAYPSYHKFGNRMFNFILEALFNSPFTDIFSGYRVFSKRFVKTFPVISDGFEIEAELSIHALTLSIPFTEIASEYFERPRDSFSKLDTIKDGFRILWMIFKLLKETRPIFFFGSAGLLIFLLALILIFPIIVEFLDTGLVPRIPTTVLTMGMVLASMLSLVCGLILESVSNGRKEAKRLHYLHYRCKG